MIFLEFPNSVESEREYVKFCIYQEQAVAQTGLVLM
jgi:hypothetical protein